VARAAAARVVGFDACRQPRPSARCFVPARAGGRPRHRTRGAGDLALDDAECELVTLDALRQQNGVGSALLAAVAKQAAARGCQRVWLITTNDNINAIRFYQRRGMRLIAVHPGAVDAARRIKPSIPVIGEHGIPIHDELEFELRLA